MLFTNQKSTENNVISLLHHHVKKYPDRLAFKWEKDSSISYKRFYEKVCSIAHYLQRLGIKKEDRVLIFVPLSVELYLVMFAVQQIGAIAVFLDSWARREQMQTCINISLPKAIISFDQVFQFCKDMPEFNNIPIRLLNEKLIAMAANNTTCPIQPVLLSDTALITFTTGSSGTPKGADRTHNFLLAQHRALKQVIPYNGKETDLPVFPIFALNNLASGITTLLPQIDLSAPSIHDGERLAKQILSQNIDCSTLSPSLFIKISDYCNKNRLILPSLKRVVTGGAPIDKNNIQSFKMIAPNAKILVLYGSTEVEPIAHIEADEMLACMEKGEGVNVGPIFKDLQYKIIKITKKPIELDNNDWRDFEVKKGEIGELIVSGDHVCAGYYNDEEAFKKAKIRDRSGKIWHRTGDLGFIDASDYFWFVGRVHNTIFRSQEVLFPVQAELIMKRLSFVRQAAFIGLGHPTLGEEACAVISLNVENQEINRLSVTQQIVQVLKGSNIPVDQIRIIDEIPMDPRHHSKVEYTTLRKLL